MLAWVAVIASALCSGTAVVLQAVAARRLPSSGLQAAGGLVRSPVYLAALALVATGFALAFVALRTLPVFVVQAGRASSLAVTALLAVPVLGARLRARDWAGLGALGAGLVVLSVAVAPGPAVPAAPGARTGMLVGVLVLVAAAALVAWRTSSSRGGLVLAVVAGLGYGLLALAARVADLSSLRALLTDPAVWAGGLAGLLGLGLTVVAMRRARVVAVTAAMVGTETCGGALLGVLLAGDRADAVWPAALAFAAVVAGTLTITGAASTDARDAPALSATG